MLFVYILLAVAVCVVLAEVAARLAIRRFEKYYVWLPGRRITIGFDTGFFPRLRSPVYHSVNSDGELGNPRPRRESGVFRVLAIGGSATACGLLDQSKTWTTVIEDRLNKPDTLRALGVRKVHVGCIGISSLDSSGVKCVLTNVLPQYGRIDLLLIMSGASDVLRWLNQGAPDGVPADPLTPQECFAVYPRTQFGWRFRQTALASCWRRLRPYFGTKYVADAGKTIRSEAVARAGVEQFSVLTEDPSGMLSTCKANTLETCRLARRHARQVMFLEQVWWQKPAFTPDEEQRLWQGRIGDPDRGPARFLSTADLYRLFKAANGMVAEAAAEAGVQLVRLQPAMNLVEDAFYDHLHFTDAGARVVGEAAAAAVRDLAAGGAKTAAWAGVSAGSPRTGTEKPQSQVDR